MKGTIHWVSAAHAMPAEVRLYDRLFSVPRPDAGADDQDFKSFLNPGSLQALSGCQLEPALGADSSPARCCNSSGWAILSPTAASTVLRNRSTTVS